MNERGIFRCLRCDRPECPMSDEDRRQHDHPVVEPGRCHDGCPGGRAEAECMRHPAVDWRARALRAEAGLAMATRFDLGEGIYCERVRVPGEPSTWHWRVREAARGRR